MVVVGLATLYSSLSSVGTADISEVKLTIENWNFAGIITCEKQAITLV